MICNTVSQHPCHSAWNTKEDQRLLPCSSDRFVEQILDDEEIKILHCKCFRFGCRWICLKWVALKLQANAFTPSPSLWYLVNVNCIWKVFAIIIFSGNIRRFRRICEHIQSMVCAARRAPPASPRAQRRSQKGTEMSESSSCGSDTSERINERLAPHRQVSNTCLPRVSHPPCWTEKGKEPNTGSLPVRITSADDLNGK